MKNKPRFPSLTVEEITSRLDIDLLTGICIWRDATKHHRPLNGKEAGFIKHTHSGKSYWIIKFNGRPYRRAQLILTMATGRWPIETVDHIDGNSLNDSATNLRHATVQQNSWNHKKRSKKSITPMGVRALPSGKFQARLTVDKKSICLGVFETMGEAETAYKNSRKENYGAFH